jgi:acyl carrier protein
MSNDDRIDTRFSAREFSRLGLDSLEAAVLALELEQTVSKQIFVKLKEAAESIVRELNEQGHTLALDEEHLGDPLEPIGISYRDEARSAGEAPRCKLRLAFDLTVSAGYAHLQDELDELREQAALRRAR